MFWGNKELERRLPKLISPFDTKLMDRATYRLTIGAEVYVSPTGVGGDTKLKTKKLLSNGEHFQIPAGQFALLITEESVSVPEDALAFISIRAGYKFQGLVNVSGFHVDPGFSGRLVFSVFNAGPGSVHLSRGEDCFHIWYADLRDHKQLGTKSGYEVIPPALIKPIAEGIQSLSSLENRIIETEKKLADRLVSVEKQQSILWWLGGVLLGVGITILITLYNRAPPRTAEANPLSNALPSSVASPSTQPGPAIELAPQGSGPAAKAP